MWARPIAAAYETAPASTPRMTRPCDNWSKFATNLANSTGGTGEATDSLLNVGVVQKVIARPHRVELRLLGEGADRDNRIYIIDAAWFGIVTPTRISLPPAPEVQVPFSPTIAWYACSLVIGGSGRG
jgi:hypothetical protein